MVCGVAEAYMSLLFPSIRFIGWMAAPHFFMLMDLARSLLDLMATSFALLSVPMARLSGTGETFGP